MAQDTLESIDAIALAKKVIYHREQAAFHKQHGTHNDFKSHRYLGSQLELRIARHARRLIRHLNSQGVKNGLPLSSRVPGPSDCC